MERNTLNNLEHIRVRPLSDEERSLAWGKIAMRMPAASTLSPFSMSSFFAHRAVSLAAVLILIAGTVGVSGNAYPGHVLFPVETAVERIETSFDGSMRADHARERLAELQAIAGAPLAAQDDGAEATNEAATMMRSKAAPEADMAAFSIAVEAPAEPRQLPPEIQAAVDATRAELERLANEAAAQSDFETYDEILGVLAEFDAYISTL